LDKEDRNPGAFMCYARINDRDGSLTKLREKLSEEVEEHIGEKFPIFQDIEDIKWGQDWKERIDESLSEVTFFIPIITPSFFKSKYCCDELKRFLNREKKLERNDLILPIYYIETPLLEKESEREITNHDSDSERDIKTLAQIISARQRADWRKLRSKCRISFNYEEIYNSLEGLATQIRNALERLPPIETESKSREIKKRTYIPENPFAERIEAPISTKRSIGVDPLEKIPLVTASQGHIAPIEIVVDQTHHGDFATISEAIRAARPGDRIVVRPGLYQEGLVIDKPLDIIGEGERNKIIIHAFGKNAIQSRTTSGRVANLALHQIGGGDWFAVDIARGSLILKGCDISSQSMACVAIHDGANPHLLDNVIHEGKKSGVYVYENGQGILEGNEIFCNAFSGVEIKKGGNPILRHNKIYN